MCNVCALCHGREMKITLVGADGQRHTVLYGNVEEVGGGSLGVIMQGCSIAERFHNPLRTSAGHAGSMHGVFHTVRPTAERVGVPGTRSGRPIGGAHRGRLKAAARELQVALRSLGLFRGELGAVLAMAPALEVLESAFVSRGLVNCGHLDTGDSSPSFAIWLVPSGCRIRTPQMLLFPKFGLALALRHGTVVSWPGHAVRHCTSAGEMVEVRKRGRGQAMSPEMRSFFIGRSTVLDARVTGDDGRQ